MLDAYIIDRIRRERDAERENGIFVPLRIDMPQHPIPPEEHDEEEPEPTRERGSVVIDFGL